LEHGKYPFLISMFEPVWIIWDIYKTVWAPLVSHTVRTMVSPVPTAFGPRFPPLCCTHGFAAHSLTAAPLLPSPSIIGAPPSPVSSHFSSSFAYCCHYAACVAVIEPPQNTTLVPLRTPRHRPELHIDIGSTFDLLAGALGCSSASPPSLPAAQFALPWNPPLR
jgi:hypothetical protein